MEPAAGSPLTSGLDSHGSCVDSLREAKVGLTTIETIHLAVSRLGSDAAHVEVTSNAFFSHAPQPSAFRVPPSEPYINELQRCWSDPKAYLPLSSDCRALAAMADVA